MIYLFGISNCDRLVKAKKMLQQSGVEFEYIDFRKGKFSVSHIESWLERVSIDELISKRSGGWKKLTEQQQTKLMANPDPALIFEHETLIKRPVLVADEVIHFGFKQSIYDAIIPPK